VTSKLGLVMLGLSLFLAAIASLLGDGPYADGLSLAMSAALVLAGLLQVPALIRFAVRGPRLPVRPRQRSSALLVAPNLWKRVNLGLFCYVVVLLVAGRFEWPLVILCLSAPLLCLVVVHQALEPGAISMRRMRARQLSASFSAGVPLAETLEQLQKDAMAFTSTRFRPYPIILSWLAFDLRCGSLFSVAVSNHSFFPPIWSTMIRIGERTNRLSECLSTLGRLEAQQPRRLHLLRSLISLPLVLFIDWLVHMSTARNYQNLEVLGAGVGQTHFFSRLNLLLTVAFGLAIFSLLAPLLKRGRLSRRLSDILQKLPWVWPLTYLEQQLLALTALEAAARTQSSTEEMLELAREACTHSDYVDVLDPARAAGGDSLAKILGPKFDEEVVVLVAYGEASGELAESLAGARIFLEGRLDEAHNRGELSFLFLFQLMTGLVVLCCAMEFLYPLLSLNVALMSETI